MSVSAVTCMYVAVQILGSLAAHGRSGVVEGRGSNGTRSGYQNHVLAPRQLQPSALWRSLAGRFMVAIRQVRSLSNDGDSLRGTFALSPLRGRWTVPLTWRLHPCRLQGPPTPCRATPPCSEAHQPAQPGQIITTSLCSHTTMLERQDPRGQKVHEKPEYLSTASQADSLLVKKAF